LSTSPFSNGVSRPSSNQPLRASNDGHHVDVA
jgi:hypothetical protein